VVVIRAFDDVPEHLFLIHSVEEDRVTGVALTGPFAGSYGVRREKREGRDLRVASPESGDRGSPQTD